MGASGRRPRTARRVASRIGVAIGIAMFGYAALDAVDVVPGVLTSDYGHEDRVDPVRLPTAVPDASGSPSGSTSADAPNPGPDVPTPVSATAPEPSEKGVAAAIAPLLKNRALGPSVGVQVRDGLTGRVLYDVSGATPRTPASTVKVLTAVAIAQAEDLTQRFETRVVTVDAMTVALVAGGDNLLAADAGDPGAVAGHAGLGDLARATAGALGPRKEGVRVVLDDRFARGPALAPGWEKADVALGLTGPVAMLGLSSDRAIPYRPASADPAMLAANTFAAALAKAGVPVLGKPVRGAPAAGGAELAVVRSAPVADVLAIALDESDNDLTETVSRWACARANAPTTFAGCADWVHKRLGDAGLDASRARLADTSGLSKGTAAPAALVAAAVVSATSEADPAADPAGQTPRNPGLSRVLAQLPVAGLSGTLADRFLASNASAGVGVVRAKTGTLTGVSSLAGTVVDRQGRLLAFAVLADRVPATGTSAARMALDRLASALASCGCR